MMHCLIVDAGFQDVPSESGPGRRVYGHKRNHQMRAVLERLPAVPTAPVAATLLEREKAVGMAASPNELRRLLRWRAR